MSKLIKKQQPKQEERYFAELDQMEADLGGILVAGPNPKHKANQD